MHARWRSPLLELSVAVLLAGFTGCREVGPPDCEKGERQNCFCTDGGTGVQKCNRFGDGWIICECGDAGRVIPPWGISEGDNCINEDSLKCGYNTSGSVDNLVLRCKDGTFQKAFQCPESLKCNNVEGNTSVCCGDETNCLQYTMADIPCENDYNAACSFDKTVVLVCLDGIWREAIHCTPSECAIRVNNNGVRYINCANGGYSVGDWCGFDEDRVACSTDLTEILRCSNGTTVVFDDCAAQGKECSIVENEGVSVMDCV